MNDVKSLYSLWCESATADPDLIAELKAVRDDEQAVFDRFYRSLEFGTGGLRGVIGAGINRMNIYTVNQATQGLCNYLLAHYEKPSVAIAYDSRIKSDVFAKSAATVFAANEIKAYLYPTLVPTPMLSFAVRKLSCSAGIVLTASHNPSKYNGYKCYEHRGYQITDEAAAEILSNIQNVDLFRDVKTVAFEDGLQNGFIEWIDQSVNEDFYQQVLSLSQNPDVCRDSELDIIYTPLNGTGNIPVRTVLEKAGFHRVRVVKTQELPDGDFPTCPYPNPEIRQAFEQGLEMARKEPTDLLLATDPDCDRVGIAVRTEGDYRLFSGNEVGAMLTQYLLSVKKENGTLPDNPIIVKSFVTTNLVTAIAREYGAKIENTLTGFKYIGEYITKLEEEGKQNDFVIGMEESYGYLSGLHARDKDGVNAALLICEMAAYYKKKGLSLCDVMERIYAKYGLFRNTLLNFTFEGASGMVKMTQMMQSLREAVPTSFGGLAVVAVSDYQTGINTNIVSGKTQKIFLPRSNVLEYRLPDSNSVIVRPSGTEPKIKIYITAKAENESAADTLTQAFAQDIKKYLGIEA